jgi:hypothetical protein
VGQIEMKCIFDIGKNISVLAKVTQVSDVAHGPLVLQAEVYVLAMRKTQTLGEGISFLLIDLYLICQLTL